MVDSKITSEHSVESWESGHQRCTDRIYHHPGSCTREPFTQLLTRFTQSDISNNLISYQHDGKETRTDSFSFTVTDGTHSDFYVFSDTSFPKRHPQTLNIEILAVDNGIPQIFINKGAAYLAPIEDGKMGYILSNKILLFRDRDIQSEELRYYSTVLPKKLLLFEKHKFWFLIHWINICFYKVEIHIAIKNEILNEGF